MCACVCGVRVWFGVLWCGGGVVWWCGGDRVVWCGVRVCVGAQFNPGHVLRIFFNKINRLKQYIVKRY